MTNAGIYIGHGIEHLLHFIKKNIVMTVAFAAALITSIIVPVDSEYLGYFDVKTHTCLFCV